MSYTFEKLKNLILLAKLTTEELEKNTECIRFEIGISGYEGFYLVEVDEGCLYVDYYSDENGIEQVVLEGDSIPRSKKEVLDEIFMLK